MFIKHYIETISWIFLFPSILMVVMGILGLSVSDNKKRNIVSIIAGCICTVLALYGLNLI